MDVGKKVNLLTCNEKVEGSIPFTGTNKYADLGGMPRVKAPSGVTPGLHRMFCPDAFWPPITWRDY